MQSPRLPQGKAVAAFDIGGTDLKAALFGADGRMQALHRAPTPHRGGRTAAAILEHVESLMSDFAREFPHVVPAAAGLIGPGLVDDDHGIAIQAANLEWSNVPFKALAEIRLGRPCSFSHDVRAAGEAEFALGAARPFRSVVTIVIGTGIAASLVIDGKAHVGGGFAVEIGHSIVDPHGEVCACGARGCLETLASAGAIVRRYRAAGGTGAIGAKDVLDRAAASDRVAQSVWNDALDALALSIAQLSAVLAPEAVIIGGGLAQAGDSLFLPVRDRVDRLLSFHRRPAVLPALLGENAGLIGAALRARLAAAASVA